MKNPSFTGALQPPIFIIAFLTLVSTSLCLQPTPYFPKTPTKHALNGDNKAQCLLRGREEKEEIGRELHPTGSSLPDCSHACGACFPCKRVMVSFKCSVAESCPTIYRCMCRGRYYHVPSN